MNVLPPAAADILALGTVFIATPTASAQTSPRPASRSSACDQTDAEPGRRRSHDANDQFSDTRRTASLVVAGRGTRRACETRTLRKAQYMLAVWTLLEAPHDDIFMPLWPIVTTWLPQPSIHIESPSRSRVWEVLGGAARGAISALAMTGRRS